MPLRLASSPYLENSALVSILTLGQILDFFFFFFWYTQCAFLIIFLFS